MIAARIRYLAVLFVVLLSGIVCAVILYQGFTAVPSAEAEPVALEEEPRVPLPEAPARLLIPAINVDAEVKHVGIAKSGNMAVPYEYDDTGWYRGGTIPGQEGSAVINGHVDTGFGLPAVFARLQELEPGDEIFVETAEGRKLRFIVEVTEVAKVGEISTDLLFNRADTARLNLITCEGAFDAETETYDSRRIIYTRFVSEV